MTRRRGHVLSFIGVWAFGFGVLGSCLGFGGPVVVSRFFLEETGGGVGAFASSVVIGIGFIN